MTLAEGFSTTRPATLPIFDSSSTLASVLGDDVGYFMRRKKIGRQRRLELKPGSGSSDAQELSSAYLTSQIDTVGQEFSFSDPPKKSTVCQKTSLKNPEMWRTQLKNPTCGEKSFSAETLVFCRARQGESIPPLSVVIREDGHVW